MRSTSILKKTKALEKRGRDSLTEAASEAGGVAQDEDTAAPNPKNAKLDDISSSSSMTASVSDPQDVVSSAAQSLRSSSSFKLAGSTVASFTTDQSNHLQGSSQGDMAARHANYSTFANVSTTKGEIIKITKETYPENDDAMDIDVE